MTTYILYFLRIYIHDIRNTSQYNAVQYETTANQDLSAKICYLINTLMTVCKNLNIILQNKPFLILAG